MQPTSAISIFAPSPSTTPADHPPSIERLIGEMVATATAAIAQALDERGNGGLTAKTKRVGEDLIVRLYSLRRASMSEGLDFDAIAREYGKRALAARYAELKHEPDAPDIELTAEMLDELVSWPLDLVVKVARSRLN